MSTIEELLKLLNKRPEWRRISSSPDRLDALEIRVKTLEERLSGSGDICPRCKETTYELLDTQPHPIAGDLGGRVDYFECSSCGYKDEVLRVPEG